MRNRAERSNCRSKAWILDAVRELCRGPGTSQGGSQSSASQPTADEMEGREFEQEVQAAPRQERVLEQETYPQSSFDTNLPKWKKLIQDGTKTAEQIIKTVQSKNMLTEDQIKTIKAIKTQFIECEVMTEEEVSAIREREMYEGAEA